MTDCINRLISALSENGRVIEEMLQLLDEEQRSIVNIDLPGLEEQEERKRQLLVRLETANNLSRQALKQAAVEMNLPEARNLSSLLPKVAPQQRGVLQELQRRLQERGAALDRLLAFNGDLLQGSLRIVSNSLAFFGRLFNRSNTYGGSGHMVTSPAEVRLIRREA